MTSGMVAGLEDTSAGTIRMSDRDDNICRGDHVRLKASAVNVHVFDIDSGASLLSG